MAFMKSVVQVTNAIENLKDPEDFQFAQKTTLTAILVVSRGPGPWAVWGPNSAELLRASKGQGGSRVSDAPFCLSSASIQL